MIPFLIALAEIVVLMGVFFTLGLMGWPGADDDCLTDSKGEGQDRCYCEAFHAGMVKQPANTWSNVAFMLVGLLIMLLLGSNSASARNPMQVASFFSVGYGMAVVFLGPGSMFFHASIKRWGGWVDNLSMNLFMSYVVVYDLVRVVHGNELVFVILYLAINITLGVITALRDGLGKFIFGGLIGSFALLEVLMLVFHAGSVNRDFLPFMLLTLISFGLAFLIWALSNTGGPLCKRDSLLQGHALWHILTAISTLFIYLYLVSEVRA